jgi:signal transduction histidine kinase
MTAGPSAHDVEPRHRGLRSWALDVFLTLLAIGLDVGALFGNSGSHHPALIVLAAVGAAPVLLRRRWPLAVLAITVAAPLSVAILGGAPGGVGALIALYTVASRCERRLSLWMLAVVVVAQCVAAAIGPMQNQSDPSKIVEIATSAVVPVGVWALGAYVQTRRRYRRELELRAEQLERENEQLATIAVHEERAEIARELHDIVAHSVAVMLVGVRGARDVLKRSPDVADDTLARVEASGEQSLAELRRILALLREPRDGAESRPQPSLADLDELIAEYRDAGLPISFEVTGDAQPLAGGVELSVYRIVQEALTNVLKHSDPGKVVVTLSFRDSQLEVEVIDDGRTAVRDGAVTGHGIVGMRERAALLGGELETGQRAGGGFRVAARLPLGGGG